MARSSLKIDRAKLISALNKSGKTQLELALDVNSGTSSVSKWLRGSQAPSSVKLEQIAKALKCTVESLLMDNSSESEAIK
jgi:transcriptional regulator with XRE-family HTH domain